MSPVLCENRDWLSNEANRISVGWGMAPNYREELDFCSEKNLSPPNPLIVLQTPNTTLIEGRRAGRQAGRKHLTKRR